MIFDDVAAEQGIDPASPVTAPIPTVPAASPLLVVDPAALRRAVDALDRLADALESLIEVPE